MAGEIGATRDVQKASREGALRLIPNKDDTEAVTTSNATLDLESFGAGNVDLRGRWVFFTARGGNVTMRRFTKDASAPTLTAGVGFTIADGVTEELYVPTAAASADYSLRVVGSASCNLDVAYSDD